MILIFYVLLKPVSKDLSLLAALFNLVQTAVLVANKLTLVAVVVFLGNTDYLKAFGFTPDTGSGECLSHSAWIRLLRRPGIFWLYLPCDRVF